MKNRTNNFKWSYSFFILVLLFTLFSFNLVSADVTTMTWIKGTDIAGLGGVFNTTSMPTNLVYSPDGLTLITSNRTSIIKYSLGTPFDTSTLSFVEAVDLNLTDGIDSFYITPNGLYLYATFYHFAHGLSYDWTYQYNMSQAFNVTSLVAYTSFDPFIYEAVGSSPHAYAVFVSDDGKLFLRFKSGGGAIELWAKNMSSSPYNINSLNTINVAGRCGISSGKTIYALGYSTDTKRLFYISSEAGIYQLHEFDLNKAYLPDTFNSSNGAGQAPNCTWMSQEKVFSPFSFQSRGFDYYTLSGNDYFQTSDSLGSDALIETYNLNYSSSPTPTTNNTAKVSYNIISAFGNFFPDASTLTFKQKWTYVIFWMFIVAFGILVLSYVGAGTINNLTLWLTLILEIITFGFFVAISYINWGIIVVIALICLALIYLRSRGSSGS